MHTKEKPGEDIWVNYKAIVAHSSDIFLLGDAGFSMCYANPSLHRITGWTVDELRDTDVLSWLHPRDITKLAQVWEDVCSTYGASVYCTFTARHKAGHYIGLEGQITNMLDNERVKAIVVNLKSIAVTQATSTTQQDVPVEEVGKETKLSDAIINSLPGVFYLYNNSGKFINWNRNFEKVSGYSAEEIAMMHPIDFFDTDEKEMLAQSIERVFREGVADVQAHFLTKNKEKIPYYFNGRIATINGMPHLIGMGIDITTLKKAEVAVMEVLGERNTILESIGDAFFATDSNWTVNYWNKEAERTLCIPKEAIIGKNLWKVFSDSVDSVSYHKYHKAMETMEVVHFEDHYPALNKWFDVSVYPSSTGLSVYFVDVTERKNDIAAKEKYTQTIEVQNRKFREIAFLQSHVVRSPLATMMGLIYVVKEIDPSKNELLELLDGIMLSAHKLDEIIREISEKTDLVNYAAEPLSGPIPSMS